MNSSGIKRKDYLKSTPKPDKMYIKQWINRIKKKEILLLSFNAERWMNILQRRSYCRSY
jgi:hypothetical protein